PRRHRCRAPREPHTRAQGRRDPRARARRVAEPRRAPGWHARCRAEARRRRMRGRSGRGRRGGHRSPSRRAHDGALRWRLRELALMDAREARRVPEPLTWEEAAATPLTFIVVYDMLIAQGRLSAGQWLLVTAVSSGVGVAALQTGKVLGARVIGTSGSADKLARLEKLGLDVGIRTRAADFHDAVLKATDGKGVSLVVNNVGGSVFAECIKSLAFEGRLATVGHMDRVLSAPLDLEALHSKRLTVFGVSNRLRTAAQRAATVRGFVKDLLPYFEDGLLRPLVDRTFGFDDLPAAIKFMESDAQVGKIVVRL